MRDLAFEMDAVKDIIDFEKKEFLKYFRENNIEVSEDAGRPEVKKYIELCDLRASVYDCKSQEELKKLEEKAKKMRDVISGK